MKISAIIVIFNPDYIELFKNINSLIDDVDTLILFQNSLIDQDALRDLKNPKIHLLGDGRNVGIASALNVGVEWSQKNNFTHLLTLDQDSRFEEGHLYRYKKLIEELKDEKIGVFALNPFAAGKSFFETCKDMIDVSDAITSGSIYPLSIFSKFGLFKDELFIDAVDYEYCYRIRTLGEYRTLVFTSIRLYHIVGYMSETFLGFRTVNYSPLRTYYIVRNHIQMWKMYPDLFPYEYKLTLVKQHILYRFIKIVLGEKDKVSKIKAILRGVINGLLNRYINYNNAD